jgi:ketosteroid isomerase-like protein
MRNYLTVTVTPPGAAPIRRAGWTLTILRKTDAGKWVLARDANLMTKVGS